MIANLKLCFCFLPGADARQAVPDIQAAEAPGEARRAPPPPGAEVAAHQEAYARGGEQARPQKWARSSGQGSRRIAS
jgi:hypothetical protein